jgi:hypothetical protein
MKLDLSAAPQGFFVRNKEGQFFFLTNAEAKRSAVPTPDRAVVEKIWNRESGKTSSGGITPEFSCATLMNYLENHEVDENWRRVSVMYMNQCLR